MLSSSFILIRALRLSAHFSLSDAAICDTSSGSNGFLNSDFPCNGDHCL